MSSKRPLSRRTSPSSTTATRRTTTFRLERLSEHQGGDKWDRFRWVRENLCVSYNDPGPDPWSANSHATTLLVHQPTRRGPDRRFRHRSIVGPPHA